VGLVGGFLPGLPSSQVEGSLFRCLLRTAAFGVIPIPVRNALVLVISSGIYRRWEQTYLVMSSHSEDFEFFRGCGWCGMRGDGLWLPMSQEVLGNLPIGYVQPDSVPCLGEFGYVGMEKLELFRSGPRWSTHLERDTGGAKEAHCSVVQ